MVEAYSPSIKNTMEKELKLLHGRAALHAPWGVAKLGLLGP